MVSNCLRITQVIKSWRKLCCARKRDASNSSLNQALETLPQRTWISSHHWLSITDLLSNPTNILKMTSMMEWDYSRTRLQDYLQAWSTKHLNRWIIMMSQSLEHNCHCYKISSRQKNTRSIKNSNFDTKILKGLSYWKRNNLPRDSNLHTWR